MSATDASRTTMTHPSERSHTSRLSVSLGGLYKSKTPVHQVTLAEVGSMHDSLDSGASFKPNQKPPAVRRPLARLLRRKSSSAPGSRRGSDASLGEDITYASPSEPTDTSSSRLTSPSMPSLALFRPKSRRTSEAAELNIPPMPPPIRPFATAPYQSSSDSIETTGSTTSPRPSLLSRTSNRTSDTSQQSVGSPSRGIQSPASDSSPSASPTAVRRPSREGSGASASTSRPGPTPVAGRTRSESSTWGNGASTRPLRQTRTTSRLSFSSITQTLGAATGARAAPPPDPQTAARLRTLPRLLSYTNSPTASSSQVPTTANNLATNDLPPPVADLPSPPYQIAQFYASRTSPLLMHGHGGPTASTSAVTDSSVSLDSPLSPADQSEPEDETEEDEDAFENPDLAERTVMDDDDPELPAVTPTPSRVMQLEMPLRSTPDRLFSTPISTPAASPGLRATPRLAGWTTFTHGTPGLTPFTARPNQMSPSSSYFDIRPMGHHNEPDSLVASPDMVTAATSPVAGPSSPISERPQMFSRRSRSLVNLLDNARSEPNRKTSEPMPELPLPAMSRQLSPPHDRPRSMYELREPPPVYYADPLDAAPVPSWVRMRDARLINPRDEEGREMLPIYSCDVHIEGYVPRKMEFTAPGVQAGNRQWRKQYVVLHGTSIKVYKADPSVYPVPDEPKAEMDARRMSVSSTTSYSASVTGSEASDDESSRVSPLHVHEGRYGEVEGESNEGFTASILHSHLLPGAAGHNACIRNYTLQSAESGLAADYLKRKHVVRVRAEGEQFLIQVKDDRAVIDWIEALQAATNIALDLDARPLPKFITLPRRRRRRRRPEDGTAAATGAEGSPNPGVDAASGMPAPREGGRVHDLLAEEQEAYMRS